MSNVVIQGFPNNGSYTRSDILGYKSYTALFTQDGINAPVPIEMENSLGFSATWVRGSAGYYYLDFPTASYTTFNKFWIGGAMGNWKEDATSWMPISSGSSVIGRYSVYANYVGSLVSGIALECYDDQWVATEFSTLFGVSSPVNDAGIYVEFRIYN